MPNQHSSTKQAATFRFNRDVLAAAKKQAGERGETLTAVLERALTEYVTPPPAPAR